MKADRTTEFRGQGINQGCIEGSRVMSPVGRRAERFEEFLKRGRSKAAGEGFAAQLIWEAM